MLNGTILDGNTISVKLATADNSAHSNYIKTYLKLSCHNIGSMLSFTSTDLSDYVSISQVLTFSSSSTVQIIQISIVNDLVLEQNEMFTVSLVLKESDDIDIVELMPKSVSVTIIDDDGINFKYCVHV